MPTFEEIVIAGGSCQEAKLYGPAKKAMENPSNGITINIPAAANVIRDCAKMTSLYLPHYVFGTMANPFTTLAKKFSLEQIEDFVKRAESNFVPAQLLQLILSRGETLNIEQWKAKETSSSDSDPYGAYEVHAEAPPAKITNVYKLSCLFGLVC